MERPVFKTFEAAEGLTGWALWTLAMLMIAFRGQAVQPSSQARRIALDILSEQDCKRVRVSYRQAALRLFPRTREQMSDPQKQADAVVINGAYEKRQEGSCKRQRTLSEETIDEVKKEFEEPKEQAEEEPKEQAEEEAEEEAEQEAEEEAEEEPKENPKEEAEFSIGQRLFQWVKWTSAGIGLGGTTLYMAKECQKPSRGERKRHPSSPGRQTRDK
jgi:hypothetical protein